MASTAVSAQGTTLEITSGSSGSAKNISGVALGNPTIVTATSHGFVVGDKVTIASVGGITTVNGTWSVIAKTTNTFAIALDTTGGASYTSGGTATPAVYVTIDNVKSLSGLDGQANDIDVTNLASTAEEIRLGIARFGGFTAEFDRVEGNTGHLALKARQLDRAQIGVRLTLSDSAVATFNAYVKKVSFSNGVDNVNRGQVEFRITGAVTWA